MAKISSYESKIEMQLITGRGSVINIPSPSIKSIVIDSDFERKMMPIIYATLTVETNLYNEIVTNHTDGKIYLHIQYFDINSSIPLYKDRIKDQFIYMPPKNFDYRTVLQNGNSNVDNSYNKLVIGMISADILNYDGTPFNAIYNNITTQELLDLVTTDREFVMDELDNNEEFDNFFIPPKSTRSETLKYIFKETKFYDTKYIYFNDFEKSYLTKICDRRQSKDKGINTVLLLVNKLTVTDAFISGMTKDLGSRSYTINLNGTNIDFFSDDVNNKRVTEVVSLSTNEEKRNSSSIEFKTNKFVSTKVEYTRGDRDPGEVRANIYNMSTDFASINKSNLDGSIFTPDKIYRINSYNENDKVYNGNYAIVNKKEIIAKRDNNYINVIQATFRRLMDE